MVSNLSIIFMVITIILSVILPIAITTYLYRRYRVSFKSVFAGVFVFILFVLILESSMHKYFLVTNTNTAKLLESPWAYAGYGAFAAGIFEECGRFLAYTFMLKSYRRWEDGVAFGIGHGGIEAILIGGATALQNLIFALGINKGVFEGQFAGKLPTSMIEAIKSSLINAPSYHFLIGGIERVFALCIQIGLSVLVLYGVKNKKYIYLLYAILLHALVDFPAALFQRGMITNVWVIEGAVAVVGILFLIYTIKSKKRGDFA